MFVSGLWMYFRNFAWSNVQSAPERACRRSLGHEEGLAMASLPLRESAAEASAWSQANEDNKVVGHHRGPDIGLEVVEPAPGAAGQAVGPLEAGDTSLDPGPEVAQLAVDPAAADHVFYQLPRSVTHGPGWPSVHECDSVAASSVRGEPWLPLSPSSRFRRCCPTHSGQTVVRSQSDPAPSGIGHDL